LQCFWCFYPFQFRSFNGSVFDFHRRKTKHTQFTFIDITSNSIVCSIFLVLHFMLLEYTSIISSSSSYENFIPFLWKN
jgi:hypothetical protein